MICAEDYMTRLIAALRQQFGARLIYVGLQGSYLRGEATQNSDIDPMVVIDDLTVADLRTYRMIVDSLGDGDKSCGFICGWRELANWNPLELCHLLHSTRDLYGALAPLVPEYTRKDVRNFAKLGVNNLYHEICHRYIHGTPEKNRTQIVNSCKSVFFILQDVYYLDTGSFLQTKRELLGSLTGLDWAVLERSMELHMGKSFVFEEVFDLLYCWCLQTLSRLQI